MREMIMRPRSSSRSWADVWARSTTAATTCRGGRWTVEFGGRGVGIGKIKVGDQERATGFVGAKAVARLMKIGWLPAERRNFKPFGHPSMNS